MTYRDFCKSRNLSDCLEMEESGSKQNTRRASPHLSSVWCRWSWSDRASFSCKSHIGREGSARKQVGRAKMAAGRRRQGHTSLQIGGSASHSGMSTSWQVTLVIAEARPWTLHRPGIFLTCQVGGVIVAHSSFRLVCPILTSNLLWCQGWPSLSDPPASTSPVLGLLYMCPTPSNHVYAVLRILSQNRSRC